MRQLFAAFIVVLCATSAFATSFRDNPWVGKQDESNISLSFLTSKTEYETEGGANFDLDRNLFGASLGYNLGDDFIVFGDFGRVMTTELVDFRDFKGDGYLFGFGAATVAYQGQRGRVMVHAGFYDWIETMKYKPDTAGAADVKADVGMYDFLVGTIFALKANPKFTPYAGLELFPLSQGEMKFKDQITEIGTGANKLAVKQTTKFKRNDVIDLKFGGEVTLDKFILRGEATMISEMTFLFSAGFIL